MLAFSVRSVVKLPAKFSAVGVGVTGVSSSEQLATNKAAIAKIDKNFVFILKRI
jgi:hypothetical protein